MWRYGIGEIGGVQIEYWCKCYPEESECCGICGGKISKLTLKQDGEIVYNYDRGEDVAPQTEEARRTLEMVLDQYN